MAFLHNCQLPPQRKCHDVRPPKPNWCNSSSSQQQWPTGVHTHNNDDSVGWCLLVRVEWVIEWEWWNGGAGRTWAQVYCKYLLYYTLMFECRVRRTIIAAATRASYHPPHLLEAQLLQQQQQWPPNWMMCGLWRPARLVLHTVFVCVCVYIMYDAYVHCVLWQTRAGSEQRRCIMCDIVQSQTALQYGDFCERFMHKVPKRKKPPPILPFPSFRYSCHSTLCWCMWYLRTLCICIVYLDIYCPL